MGKEQRPQQIEIKYLLEFYSQFPNKEEFFTNFFNLLAGNNELQEQIKNGKTEEEIRSSWVEDLKHFRVIRNKYLIYPD